MRPVEKRAEALRKAIRRHDQLYFVEASPEISDQQYDELVAELRAIEREHPELVTPDSPTQRVGGAPLEGFEHVEHAVPMLSIDNTYSPEELREFDGRIRRGLDNRPYDYLVDPKIDGIAVSLRYVQGRLRQGATRGDGWTGDDITQNLRSIRSIPLRLHGDDWPAVVEVRGEVYWPRTDFDRVNAEREQAGLEPFKNPRNATAGTLKQLDPSAVADRKLVFQSHGFGQIEPFPQAVLRFSDLLERFRGWGLPVSRHTRRCATIDAVIEFVAEWDALRHGLEYETDGLVVKVDDLAQRAALGTTSKSPRWCIAFKYAAERGESRLLRVDLQVGKLGTITPRAVMEPVQLSGTTVKHASLHNFDQVERLDVRVGDTVIVEKAGEIIPQIVGVVREKRPPGTRPLERPKRCPECGGDVARDEGGVYLRCLNPACPAQRIERLKFFVGRDQMDIDGLGEVVVEKLVQEGLVRGYADIFGLSRQREQLEALTFEQQRKTEDGGTKTTAVKFGTKRTDTLIAGVEKARRQPLARVLAALNIRHIGASTAELLAEHFGTMAAISRATDEALLSIEGIGPELARSLRTWFDSEAGQRTIRELEQAGVNMTQPRSAAVEKSAEIDGRTFVVTGTLEKFTRKQIQDLIKAHGGKVTSSVSKSTDFVVAGADPGGKLDKAQQLGVRVLNEAEFEAMLNP